MENNIAHAVVIKDDNLFFLSERDGGVSLERGHGFGLYYNDCRFLDGYELRVGNEKPELRRSNSESGNVATLDLTNPEFEIDGEKLARGSFEICWSRTISCQHLTLFDSITLRNLTTEPIRFPLLLIFQSHFEDIFAVRGMTQSKRGTLHPPEWKNGALHFFYEGADAIDRRVVIHFSTAPAEMQGNEAPYWIALEEGRSHDISVSLCISETTKRKPAGYVHDRAAKDHQWLQGKTQIRTDNLLLDRVLERSLRDLSILRSSSGNAAYFAAGVPWYVALFGRDSIITSLQTLAYDPGIAEETIRLLANYQGKEIDPWRDEEPGKILHELRVGEMAHLNEIPHTPYYGTIDATPLWLVLVGRHAAWSGDLRVFNELQSSIEAALHWIDDHGDFNRDGYVEYQCRSEQGLVNQGWKDSADGIVNGDGSLGTPPIALVEVQGYVYEAKMLMASLYRRAREEKRATLLENQAQRLRENFNRDFWVADGYYALALQEGKRQAAVLSSNAGHALWSGIADRDHARQTADHLLSRDMFSGWGIRTLSVVGARYDPLGYHLGTVWPHDNVLIAAGFKRYGFDQSVLRVLNGLLAAAACFDVHRLPELFAGFARKDSDAPVSYPIACQPQAWSAGAIPYLLTTTLGLEPEAFDKRLRIVRPTLPENINRVEIQQLRVGSSTIDLLFERGRNGIAPRVLKNDGNLEVVVES